jgi:preprotein translocase subunit SecG
MMTFIAILHIFIALALIGLVLVQDSKGGAMGSAFGGGGSNSLLGATGATTLAAKLTRWVAGIFAITCISLSIMTSTGKKSVVDSLPVTAPAATAPVETAPAAASEASPAATTETAPTQNPAAASAYPTEPKAATPPADKK